jgi:hypothetical protein
MPQYWALDDAEVEAHISYVSIALDNGALPDELIPAYWQGWPEKWAKSCQRWV